MNDPLAHKLKILVIGDSKVGKSSLLSKYVVIKVNSQSININQITDYRTIFKKRTTASTRTWQALWALTL
jgi:GTPase SAR1 family protein